MLKNRNRKFGIELEFSTDYNDALTILKEAVSSVYGPGHFEAFTNYKHTTGRVKWEFKTDVSTACELTSPIISLKQKVKLKKLLKAVQALNLEITECDSVHVHIRTSASIKQLITTWLYFERLIFRLFPRHRRTSEYCSPLISRYKPLKPIANYYKKALELCDDHHCCFSLFRYDTRSTVEFRLSEGSDSYKHIIPLIMFTHYLIEFAENLDPSELLCEPTENSLADMVSLLQLDSDTAQWVIKRFRLR